MKFVPKKDLWLSIVIWSSIIALLVAGLSPIFIDGPGIIGGTIVSIFCFAFAFFMIWIWSATYYVLKETELFIRTGPITKSIPFHSITKVKPIRSWIASAATSSRRVEIHFGKYDVIHVSPMDQETFLIEMKKRCPNVDI